MKTRILYILLSAVLLTGCFTKVEYKTRYMLKPMVQAESGDPFEELYDAQAFAYDADTTEWMVASYDDALNGVITNKTTSEKQTTPLLVAEYYEEEGQGWQLQMPVSTPRLMIVAVDTQHKIYTYTVQTFPENLPNLYVSLPFKLWQKGKSYRDGKWSYYNEFYTPPPTVRSYVDATVELTEGAAPTAIPSAKVYAYAADTTAWYIASYADAAAGIITSKAPPYQQRTVPSFDAYNETGSTVYGMTVTSETLMIVVVDRTDRVYAYSKQTVNLSGEPATFPIVLRPWKEVYVYVEEGWRVVNEAYKEPEPESTIRR